MNDAPHTSNALRRISFGLMKDEDGYPPADWEHLWARDVGGGLFELDNTPFFAKGVSYRDIVAVEQEGDKYEFKSVIRRSGHTTLRVILFDIARMEDLRRSLRDLGCFSELSHDSALVAVDVPPESDYSRVQALLQAGGESGYWEYEESALRH